MQLDYRCFIRVNDPTVLSTAMKEVEIEARDGKVYSLDMIAEVFSDTKQPMQLTQEPIGDIFDTVSVDEDIGFCFIHDHRKTFRFFDSLTEYLYETFIDSIGDEFVLVADVTNYDDDSFGNHVFYYLGDGDSVKTLEIKGPDGLEMHAEKEVSELLHILKDYNLSKSEKASADKYYIKLDDLMAYNFLHSGKKTQKPKKGKQPEKKSKEMESRSKKASEEMYRIVGEAEERAKIAERNYDAGVARVQRMAGSSISVFDGDAVSRVADIAKLTRKICDELYAAYQSLVESVDDQCRPLLDEGPKLDAVEAVYDLIKRLNDESEIESNFSASFNSRSLGDIASGRYVPKMENKMIEQFWALKCDTQPECVEEDPEREKQKMEARRRKEEEEKKEKTAKEKYEKQLSEWKQKTDEVKRRRENAIEQAVSEAKNRRVSEIEKEYATVVQKAKETIEFSEKRLARTNEALQTLGFSQFGEKSRLKKIIEEMNAAIAEAKTKQAKAEEHYAAQKKNLNSWITKKTNAITEKIEKENPLPNKPKKPFEIPRTPREEAVENMKEMIFYRMNPGTEYAQWSLIVGDPYERPPVEFYAALRELREEGDIITKEVDGETLYVRVRE